MLTHFHSTFIALLLPALVIANSPITPNKNILERAASSSCEDIFAHTCPGSTNCCPQLWECKKNDPTLCTASIDTNNILTVSAIDIVSVQASVSREIDGIRSQISGALASITGGGSVVRTTPVSSATRSAASAGGGQQASSGSQALAGVTSTPTVRSSASTASVAAATGSVTGAAASPELRMEFIVRGLLGLGMFLL
ncbi:hypothetical protein EK21DRAFT_111628 [Setomelanomma holmii]|uniref:Uncharacterized protein n=1 Tax=Setomelanomma holmii TaxID=210430 RepID=A0A9P4HCX0_9PLEO|nr:hypothetical protein EK21DRAFT_111628 [Setomelanomma holmii]